MEKLTPEEREEAIAVVLAECRPGAFAFGDNPDDSAVVAGQWLDAVEARARELHRRYTDACNRPLSALEQDRVAGLEGFIRSTFERVGLGLYLNGDPRGNPVGILTPKTGRYNTMGGREAGWRL